MYSAVPLLNEKVSSMLRMRTGASCSALPVWSSSARKGSALPSPAGSSSASSSTTALSMPRATAAARKCSTVWMRASPMPRVVPSSVPTTYWTWAGTGSLPARSVRRKTIPVFTGAGSTLTRTGAPVCSPTPSTLPGSATVF
jgi:hypothetical protein